MPQFNLHTPKTQSDIKAMRMNTLHKPSGYISEGNKFNYGFDGDKYFVTEGVLEYFVTMIHLSFDEAKQLSEALNFNDCFSPDSKVISNSIRTARKQKIYGKDLFWFLTDKIN